jgi:hypothetical protein
LRLLCASCQSGEDERNNESDAAPDVDENVIAQRKLRWEHVWLLSRDGLVAVKDAEGQLAFSKPIASVSAFNPEET